MKLTARSLRNIAFAIMLATIPLARQTPVFADTNCGPWYLQSLCSESGGYIVWRACDDNSCVEPVGGSNCYDHCIACGGGDYNCFGGPGGGGLP